MGQKSKGGTRVTFLLNYSNLHSKIDLPPQSPEVKKSTSLFLVFIFLDALYRIYK